MTNLSSRNADTRPFYADDPPVFPRDAETVGILGLREVNARGSRDLRSKRN
jgi:hypothetical protein